MPDIHDLLGHLRRPALLVRAARIGAQDYDRDRDLARLIGSVPQPGTTTALARLIEIEADREDARRARAAGYRAARHVAVLSAIMGEAQHLAAPPPPGTPGISALRLVT